MSQTTKSSDKPTSKNLQDLERQPMIMLVCGMMGVGKTYRNKLEIRRYLREIPETGKKARKVLAFDTNDDDYPEFRTISPNHLRVFKNTSPRRIRPFNADGSPMGDDEKKGVVSKIMKTYRDGLIVLDDIDHYMAGAKNQNMIGALVTVRHKGVDIILGHQSIAKISTTEWQTCTWLRLHHQVDDVTRYRERIPKYRLVRIAQLIVDEQYDLASDKYEQGEISKDEYKKQKSFFVYVNMPEQKLKGCSRSAFIRACKKYIDREEGGLIKMMLLERDFKDRPIYKNRNEAVIKLISDYLRFHDNTMAVTFKQAG